MNGVASGFRSRPWNTTPAAASVAPTNAPASVRGSRATKKICASTLSANGMEKSNARRRLIDVEPTSGAEEHRGDRQRAEAASVCAEPAAERHARDPIAGAARRGRRPDGPDAVPDDLGLDAVELADVVRRQDVVGRARPRSPCRRGAARASGTGPPPGSGRASRARSRRAARREASARSAAISSW